MESQITFGIEGKSFTIANKKNLPQSQKIYVIVRPEDVKVWGENEITADETIGKLPGIVEQVIYKGSTVDLLVRLPSGKRIAATEFFDEDDPNLDYHITEKVWLNWIAGWEVILPY